MIQDALGELLEGRDLGRDRAREVMDTIMSGEATPAQIGGFLVALRFKGETPAEIAGCAEAMREHVLAVKPKRKDLVDTAGTGGDNAHTLNISELPAHPHTPVGAAGAPSSPTAQGMMWATSNVNNYAANCNNSMNPASMLPTGGNQPHGR